MKHSFKKPESFQIDQLSHNLLLTFKQVFDRLNGLERVFIDGPNPKCSVGTGGAGLRAGPATIQPTEQILMKIIAAILSKTHVPAVELSPIDLVEAETKHLMVEKDPNTGTMRILLRS